MHVVARLGQSVLQLELARDREQHGVVVEDVIHIRASRGKEVDVRVVPGSQDEVGVLLRWGKEGAWVQGKDERGGA